MKERITITIDKKILNLLDKRIEDKTFGTRSHALEFLIKKRINLEESKKEEQ